MKTSRSFVLDKVTSESEDDVGIWDVVALSSVSQERVAFLSFSIQSQTDPCR